MILSIQTLDQLYESKGLFLGEISAYLQETEILLPSHHSSMATPSGSSAGSSLSDDYAIVWQMQYSADYFDFFMRGRRYPGSNIRQNVFENFSIPRNRVPRADPALRPQRRPRTRIRRAFWRHRRTDDGSSEEIDEHLKVRLQKQGFTIGRILGAGSQGLAIEVHHQGKRMVLKYSTHIEAIVTEMWALRKLVGAQHILQASLQVQTCPPEQSASKYTLF